MEDIKDSADLAQLLETVGRWQIIQFLLLTASAFTTAFTTMEILLIGYQPQFRCAVPPTRDNGTSIERQVSADKCSFWNTTINDTAVCPYKFEYEGGKHVSFVAEWDLVCDKDHLADLSQTVFLLGMVFGANVITHMADRFGRKPLLLLTGCATAVLFPLMVFIPNYISFIFIRFALGFFSRGLYDVKIVLILEMFPVRWRGTMIILDGLSWGIAVTVLGGLGYVVVGMNWRHVQLILLSCLLVIVTYFFLIDESVRWLMANGKTKRAANILRKVERINMAGLHKNASKTPDVNCEYRKEILECSATETMLVDPEKLVQDERMTREDTGPSSKMVDQVHKYNVLDIIKHPRSRFVLFAMCLVWFTDSLVYFGLFLMTTAMSGDRLLNVLLSAAVEIPAMGGLYICTRWLGRRRGCIGLHLACAVSLLLAMVFSLTTEGHTNDVLMKIVSVIGKLSISASFILIYFYTPELLPTNFRAAGLGIASGSARLGSVLAPFSSFVFRKVPWAPGAVFGGLSLFVSVLLIYIPETGDKELPRNLEDIDNWHDEDGDKSTPGNQLEDSDLLKHSLS